MSDLPEQLRPLDRIDEQIIAALREEPRATSKSLALKLGLTEVAVASRIKALERDHVMRVVAQLDFRALSYDVLAIVDIRVRNGKIGAVAEALANLEEVGSVSIMLGDPALIVQVQAPDLVGLRDLVINEIAEIDGVEQVETNIISDIAKYKIGAGSLKPHTSA